MRRKVGDRDIERREMESGSVDPFLFFLLLLLGDERPGVNRVNRRSRGDRRGKRRPRIWSISPFALFVIFFWDFTDREEDAKWRHWIKGKQIGRLFRASLEMRTRLARWTSGGWEESLLLLIETGWIATEASSQVLNIVPLPVPLLLYFSCRYLSIS